MGNKGSKSSSSTKVYQEQNNTVIDTNTVNNLNELVNTTAVNTIINNVKKCSAALLLNQNVQIVGVKASGDVTINIKQLQQAGLNFSCAQKDEIKSDVVNSMISTIMDQIDHQSQVNLINKLQAKVATSSSASSSLPPFPWGGSSSSSNTDITQKVNNYVETHNTTNIQNVISNAVYANFTNSNYDECIAQIIAQQGITVQNVETGGKFTFTADQQQATTMVTQCIQNANVTVRAVNDISTYLGIVVKKSTDVSSETDTSAEAETSSSATNSLFPSFNIPGLGDLGGIIGGLSSLSSLLICCILILAVIVMAVMMFLK